MPCLSDSTLRQFVRGEGPAAAEREIVSHLDRCDSCRERADHLVGGVDWIQASAHPPITEPSDSDDTLHVDRLRDKLYELPAGEHDFSIESESLSDDLLSSDRKLWRLLFEDEPDGFEGSLIGRFRLQKLLGSGGFGIVFKARDEVLQRDVALKLPRINAFAREELRSRSLREAEAAAMLHHPNIVAVLEAGRQGPLFYIAYFYCKGPTLEQWMQKQTPVDLKQTVEIVRQLANGIHHAHQNGILHRDIKPSNVLLEPTPSNSLPFSPKLTDFGLAKFIDNDALTTRSRYIIGTPAYMSPEHARQGAGVATTRSDIYALGVVLYELLTGVRPVDGADYGTTLQQVINEVPIPPRKHRGDIPRDLEAICLKCLEKDPSRRYDDAGQLRDDLQRFSKGEATVARPLSEFEHFRRWALRKPVTATLFATVLAGLVLTAAGLLLHNYFLDQIAGQLRLALDENDVARAKLLQNEERLRDLLYVSEMQRAERALAESDYRQAAELLTRIENERLESINDLPWTYLRGKTLLNPLQIVSLPGELYDFAFAPEGSLVATAGSESVLHLLRSEDLSPLKAKSTDQGEINGIAFSPAGNSLATTGDDGSLKLLDAESLTTLRQYSAHDALAYSVAFTPDEEKIVTSSYDRTWRVFDAAAGQLIWQSPAAERAIEAAAISPAGDLVATAGSDHTVRLWDLERRREVAVLRGHTGRVVDVCFSNDGRMVASASLDGTARVWRVKKRELLTTIEHVDSLCSVDCIDTLPGIVTGDYAGSIHLWRFNSGAERFDHERSWVAHEGRVWKVAWNANDQTLYSAGEDGVLAKWRWDRIAVDSSINYSDQPAPQLTLENELVIFRPGPPPQLEAWDLERGELRRSAELPAELTPDDAAQVVCQANEHLLVLSPAGPLRRISVENPSDIEELPLDELRQQLFPEGDVPRNVTLRCSDDGTRVAVRWSGARHVTVFDLATGESLYSHPWYCDAIALSADGKLLAINEGNDAIVVEIATGDVRARLKGHRSTITSLSFRDDAQLLASGGKDRRVILWDLSAGQQLTDLEGHREPVRSVTFSHDGQLLASGDDTGQLRIWLVSERTVLLTIPGQSPIRELGFGARDRRLLVTYDDGYRLLGPHRWSANRARGFEEPLATTSRPPRR